jgi:hypothetical protein
MNGLGRYSGLHVFGYITMWWPLYFLDSHANVAPKQNFIRCARLRLLLSLSIIFFWKKKKNETFWTFCRVANGVARIDTSVRGERTAEILPVDWRFGVAAITKTIADRRETNKCCRGSWEVMSLIQWTNTWTKHISYVALSLMGPHRKGQYSHRQNSIWFELYRLNYNSMSIRQRALRIEN